MTWKSASVLRREYSDGATRNKLLNLFSIRQFVLHGVRSAAFKVPPSASDNIFFTPLGTEELAGLIDRKPDLDSATARFAIFLCFYHQDLLVDLDTTQVEPLREVVNANLLSGDLRYPWLFDHVLYDRAFDQFAEIPENILREDTEVLLRDTPPGVSQLGTLVAGPFGVLESSQSRYFPPRRDLLLSHCSDATCNFPHVANISVARPPFSELVTDVNKALGRLGPFSSYPEFVAKLQVGYSWYDDFSWENLPWLLGSAFSEREIRLLLTETISTGQSELRGKFPSLRKLRGSATDIASRLSKEEGFQILLLARDESIVSAIDALVERGEIVIPMSETRIAVASAEGRSWNHLHCECSQLGVRVVSREGSQPLARLRRLILQVYTSASDRKQLAWMLGRAVAVGGIQDDTLGREVERYILERSPASALRELIFVSHDKLTQALAHVCAKHLELPADRSEDRRLVDRILWKLGFPRTHFDSKLEAFYEKLSEFRKAALSSQSRMEEWKEKVRAAGVNCFAVAEEVLDLSLAFSAWLFLSDHFAEKHVFNLYRARLVVSEELSGVIRTEDGPLELSAAGDNTLFPLVSGFLALAQRLSDLLRNPDKYKKPEVLLAHYSHDSILQLFPYKHHRFVFDASKDELDQVLKLLQSSSSSLQQSSVIGVRNGVIHPKQKFPMQADICTCCSALEDTVRALEEAGLVPVIYGTVKVQDDAYRRNEVTSVNYGTRYLKWSPSPALHVIKSLPSVRDPQVIVPSLHLADTAEVLRFRVEEESEYRELWKSYPKRRAPSKEDIDEVEAPPETQAAAPISGSPS